MLSLLLYSLFFFISYIIIRCSLFRNTKNIKVIITSIFVLSLLAALRYNVGTDWQSYYDYFKYVGTHNWGYMEPLYNVINIIVYKLTRSYSVLCFVIAFLIQYFTYKALDNYNKNISKIDISLGFYILSFTLFVTSLNTMRQGLAISIILYASIYLLKKEYIKYVLLVILASLIHYSAFICILFIIFRLDFNTKINKIFEYIYYFSIIVTLLFGEQISYIILELLSVLDLYSKYQINTVHTSLGYLVHIIPFVVIMFCYRFNYLDKSIYINILFKISLLQFVFQNFGNYIEYADRLALYSSSFQIILLPHIESDIVNKVKKSHFRIFIYIYTFLVFLAIFLILGGNDIFPYIFNFTF